MQQPQNKPLNHYVKKDNELIKAQFYDMSVTAYRIILLASSDKFIDQIRENPLAPIRINPLDYHDVFGGTDVSAAYKALKMTTGELLNAKLRYRNIKKEGVAGTWAGGTNWIDTAAYNDTLKALEITFTPGIIPLILDVQQNYTYYNLRNIAKLSSMHSIRLYELMMFWRKKGSTPALSIAYMRTWLGVKDGSHEEVKLFQRDVIKKSVVEITGKTDITLEFEPQKKGRTTVGYTFSYTPKISQVNENGEDESYGQGWLPSNFPPPNEVDDENMDLPF
ncbi:RepB family plasmid replication initiator protein [Acinetobacter brisouii]|uniref:RepB family plasmid replication initiator protein n=1 Tax=Acinetobacter brisouii TaxID=396323 RepID=UPI00124D08D4|nr:RepB family plasmid replication initiator protein [Acinetobacter brisouii]